MTNILAGALRLSLCVALILSPCTIGAEEKAEKTENKDKKDQPKPKNIDKTYGKEGTLNESKAALVSVDPLALQNYSKLSNNFDFASYDKVTLKSVILETLSQSNDLKSANEKVIQTELQYKEAYAAYYPTIDFQYSVKKIHNLENGTEDVDKESHRDFNEENYKLTMRQNLYSGGATELKIKSLEAKVQEAKRKYKIVLDQEIQKAIKAYFDVLFGHRSVVVNERNMEKLNKILEITQIKYDSGALSIGDLSAVQANIANASGKLIRVKSDLADAIDFYLYTVGEDFMNTAPFEDHFPIELTTLEALYENIVEKNLGLQNYRLNIQSTKDKLLNMKATFKPKVDLELNYKNVLDKEDFEANEETYDAKVTLNYNLYNGGKDTIATMQVFSSLQELNYRYKEELKKLKWSVTKLFNSIKSLEETLTNTKKEVLASTEMVNSYWEGFQLGEQDLQVLLQGQRQLNGAELDLLRYEQDHLTNVFKLLNEKGELSEYFGIDPYSYDFIDFTNTDIKKDEIKIDLTQATSESNQTISLDTNSSMQDLNSTDQNETNNTEENLADLNTTIDTYLDFVKKASFEDILNFKDDFLQANDQEFTVVIRDFTNHYDAYLFAKENRILENGFSYEYFDKNGVVESKNSKTKVISVKTNIAFGIHPTVELAQASLAMIEKKGDKKFEIMPIGEVKRLYEEYVQGLETKVEPDLIKPKIIKTFLTNQEFKNRFLQAPKEYFSINIVSFSQMNQAEQLIKSEKIEKDSLVFRYGRNGEWIKVMYGIFPTYEAAVAALEKHPEMTKRYAPVIEKIEQKQALFEKYKEFNKLPQWVFEEQKQKQEEIERKKKEAEDLAKKEKRPKPIVVATEATQEQPNVLQEEKKDEPKDLAQGETKGENGAKVEEKEVTTPEIIKAPLTPLVLLDVVSSEPTKNEVVTQGSNKESNSTSDDQLGESIHIPESSDELILEFDGKLHQIEKQERESKGTIPATLEESTLETPKDLEVIKVIETIPTTPSNKDGSVAPSLDLPAREEIPTSETSQINESKESQPHTALKETPRVPQEEVPLLLKNIEPSFDKGSYSSFTQAFNNAPKTYYTLQLGVIPFKEKPNFIARFVLGDNYTTMRKGKQVRVFYDLFDSKEAALEGMKNLHPKIIQSVTITQIGSLVP